MQNIKNRQTIAHRLQLHLKKYWRLHVMALPVIVCLVLFSYALMLSLMLNELLSQRLAKGIQTILIMPHFLSMAVIAMIVSAFMGKQYGLVNAVRQMMGLKAVDWYITRSVWPPLLVFINAWKTVGYSAVVYLATISGISHEYYEAAVLDGASKLQQALYITLPYMRPMISIMLIMAVGNIFRGDFGLFYTVPQNNGMLYPVTNVIDTYIYRARPPALDALRLLPRPVAGLSGQQPADLRPQNRRGDRPGRAGAP